MNASYYLEPAAYESSLHSQYLDASWPAMDGLNDCRTARTAEVLSDFRILQFHIASIPIDPPNPEDYYTEGWAMLRQCAAEGYYILECAADTTVPVSHYGQLEQDKAELKQVLLDAYARRHEAQKIVLRQAAVQSWIGYRHNVLNGQRPNPANHQDLAACDEQFRIECVNITDEAVYYNLISADRSLGRWTNEDPSLRSVMDWLQERK